MTMLLALCAGLGVFLAVEGGNRSVLADRLSQYLMPTTVDVPPAPRSKPRTQWVGSVVAGGLIGALLAQGDLFIAGTGRSVPALTALGAAGGYFVWSARRSNAHERMARRLRFELPVVADAIALHIVAGSSVSAAIRTVTQDMEGVSIDELLAVTERENAGDGLAASLLMAARTTAHADGRRLYDLLAHAHESGGRLATMLAELADDLRAGIERDLSAEGGRRAVVSYGPVLALMVPVALLFLLYPTLLGLRALSGTP